MYRHTVHYYETDKMGVAHHSNYIRWMEEARVAFLDSIGWDYARVEEEGIVSPVLGIECRYRSFTRFSDTVDIDVWVESFTGARLRFGYDMKNSAGQTVFTAVSEHCFMNPQGRVMRLKRDCPRLYDVLMSLAQEKAEKR
ncbi:MAG: acyl-CoA thioesterase [Oscillospiraceae bacterium]|jgi:acyl-CoA thioester hydrolase|nr:acyl-CoA thioesterase [Oscillospiraceae bacterium]